MVTKQKQELMVRLIAEGQDTIQKLIEKGFSQGEINCLSSPADRDNIASKNGEKLTLNRKGADLLYQLKQTDKILNEKKIVAIATVVAAIGSVLSAILLGIQTLLQLSR